MRASAAAREVVAVATVEDGATLELAVRLPPAWPLKPAEVECRRRVGVSEGRLRMWLLSVSAFLRNQVLSPPRPCQLCFGWNDGAISNSCPPPFPCPHCMHCAQPSSVTPCIDVFDAWR